MLRTGWWTAAHGFGMWLIGLGFGMGWAHQYTSYPAIWGAGLVIAGCLVLLLYAIANARMQRP
jgi:hypothetical protein